MIRHHALRCGGIVLTTGLPLFGLLGLAQCSGSPEEPYASAKEALLVLPPPIITFSLQNGDGYCLDDPGDNPNPGASVQAYPCNGTPAQSLSLNQNGQLTNSANMCLDAASGGELQFNACSGAATQVWTQQGLQIVGAANQCLNATSTTVSTGGLGVNLVACNGSTSQEWSVINKQTAIHGVGSKCLDIKSGSTTPGARLQLLECDGAPTAEVFTFTAAGEVKNASGECLDVPAGNVGAGQVQMWTCNGGQNQKWRREGREIVSNLEEGLIRMCLSTVDANGSFLESSSDHTAVGLAPCNGTEAQQWIPENLYLQNNLATLLVVTSDALAPAFTNPLNKFTTTTFVSWKQSIGIPTKVVTVSQARSAFPASDDALSIKLAIEDAYRNAGARYVLLAGDATQMPVRYRGVLDGTSCNGNLEPQGSTRSFQFSELYFANLYHGHLAGSGTEEHSGGFDNWDANGNGIFDELDWSNPLQNPDNVDGFPDIAVGRIPVSEENDLQGILQKIVSYEKQNPVYGGTFAPAGLYGFAADVCYPGANTDALSIANSVGVGTPGGAGFVGYSEEIGLGCGSGPGVGFGPPFINDDANWTLFQSAVQNSKFEWVTYVGHGGPNGLGYQQSYNETQVSSLRNTYDPVVMAAGCQTAQFAPAPACNALTYRPSIYDSSINDSATNIGSEFLRNLEGGAVAYVGENLVMPDSLPTSFVTTMYGMHGNGYQRIGDMFRMSQQTFFGQHTPPTASDGYFQPRIYPGIETLLADPSMRTP